MDIAIIGGTGSMGFGLALRLARAGHEVLIGSREAHKARDAAQRARESVPGAAISGMSSEEAADKADLAVLSVPSAGHRSTLLALREQLRGKPVLDVTIPFAFDPLRYAPPPAGSNALETAEILGPGCRVAAGFHTISAALLTDLATPLAGDTLIAANDAAAKELVMGLAREMGLAAYDAGSLALAYVLESMTTLLMSMNRHYGSNHLGIRITGLDETEIKNSSAQ